ncbi:MULTISPECIES: hypothetical protein [Cytobacillus]|jgi:hypothetical protein|uniref:hypothetical protein n=1 Tax=Cytobacillus TaxID=2675230 RepID=UPI0013579599|nr:MULTISPECIES: hypothetical protein [Cytobacillus]KAF0818096.1 hypothetical protein KIS4809_2898 [Bacillus sp. ZZV12-4809]MCM3094468.1 hypothetical protein [Cytobacillus sp. AMY 15.2]QOK26867.1 hypothetical protein IIE26_25445 [Cytobacillus oceanisediminis]
MSVFIQNSHKSIINSIKFREKDFAVLSIGVMLRDFEGFTYNFIKGTFKFPLFFVLPTFFIDDEETGKMKQLQIDYLINKNSKWVILKVDSKAQFKLITKYCEWLLIIVLVRLCSKVKTSFIKTYIQMCIGTIQLSSLILIGIR